MLVDSSKEDGGQEIDIVYHMKLASEGMLSLFRVCQQYAIEGKMKFYKVGHKYDTGVYTCN